MSEGPDESDPRADELDSLRIRQVSALRRATWRSRSHAIIAAAVCGGLALQFLWLIVRQIRGPGVSVWAVGYALLAIVCVLGVVWFAQRAAALHRQARQSLLCGSSRSPDFSTLGDGSQQARNLEEIR